MIAHRHRRGINDGFGVDDWQAGARGFNEIAFHWAVRSI